MKRIKHDFLHESGTILLSCLILSISIGFQNCAPSPAGSMEVSRGSTIALLGNNLCSRMMNYGHFETMLHLRFPDSTLVVRNMCDGGDTPGFRPHSGRVSPWAFPGAERFQSELTKNSGSQGHFETPDDWLTRLQADIIIACFGYNESFEGLTGLQSFKEELTAFVLHTKEQKYDGSVSPKLVLVSPIAYEDLSVQFDLPNGKVENEHLNIYMEAMREVADSHEVHFVDAFTPSSQWFERSAEAL
ncbi:MAG: SGNH/GDSL hydrolase family protein, partial [Saprospiraceae bacterium]|nr:SGNH/GDSL hydrolase family protein [Saprospiraceae bacterium]